ncbi:MAG: OmpA family protein [Pseudomonadota bacterium]|nr:OmpA family protein [Pseudomonadota bacterium]
MGMLAVAIALGLAAQSAGQEQSAPPAPLMVFFDWGKPDLRSDDQSVLDQVAAAYRGRPSAHLQIAGHSDGSGRAAVNCAAGLRRAQTVRAELEKRGIPRNAMTIVSFGEDRPLVPTEDGVREVQNRRVVIAFEE